MHTSPAARPLLNLPNVFYITLILLVMCLLSPCVSAASNAGTGYVDSVKVADNKLTLQGWAGAAAPAQQIVAMRITLGNRQIYQGPFERMQRPDVAKSTQRSDWLRSGWRISIPISDDMAPGNQPILVTAIPDAGPHFDLPNSESAATQIPASDHSNQKNLVRATKAILIFALAFGLFVFVYAEKLSCAMLRTDSYAAQLFAGAVVLCFASFVSLGLTGSSINFGLKNTPFISSDMVSIWGAEQPIRSDEWLVLTPLAIAQYNHQPANPVINTHHGEDGQNMLIVGMTGVPVAHVSQLAKPATWGFYLFDLKRALAWDWNLPLFGCLLALWAVFCVLLPGRWRGNFIASLIFSLSPYVVGWSLWPAYATLFPCLVFLAFVGLLTSRALLAKATNSVVLGVAFAGFVFILYPPWQVSLGYVFVAVTIGVAIRDQLYKKLDLITLGFLFVSLTLGGIIVGLWWMDAKPAIEAMENTVYPGQRTTVLGGNLSLPFILRGFTNIQTLQQLSSPVSNQSEIASFYYVLLPLLTAFLIAVRRRVLGAVEISLAVFIAFTLTFMTVGIPEFLAKYSMWGRVPANRADLGLGLSTLILAVMLVSRIAPKHLSNLGKLGATLTCVVWAYVIYRSMHQLDESIISGLSSGVVLGVLMTTGAIGYSLIAGNRKDFLVLSLALAVATTATMNPLSIAPKSISNTIADASGIPISSSDKIITLNNMLPSMFLLASGARLHNGIYYYPQQSLWAALDPKHEKTDVYNRYQHLFFTSTNELGEEPFEITTPQSDIVRVNITARRFDFRMTGATILASPSSEDAELMANPGLRKLISADGWSWYRISDR
ncbi:DUF7657 domain-containing protein [Pseudomonas cremoricolorata]|uniref:DUF7657 domain-containing protein n=1 Tax=Pseudomonas cremoricolorata TaxID=157783 RepID=UPI0006765123|nr:hypothetical protein [Pseudomonas cremoricolorata]